MESCFREVIERKQGEIRELYSQRLETLLSHEFSMSSSMFQSPHPASSCAAASPSANKENSNVDHVDDFIEPAQEINTSGYSLRSRDTSSKKFPQIEKSGPESSGKRSQKGSSKKQMTSQDDMFASGKDVVANLYSQIDEAA